MIEASPSSSKRAIVSASPSSTSTTKELLRVAPNRPRRPRSSPTPAAARRASSPPFSTSSVPAEHTQASRKRSKELMEQDRQVLEERGDIQKLYQEDGPKVAAAAVNGKNNQPWLDTSNPVEETLNLSPLESIQDPEKYSPNWNEIEAPQKELKRLRGEVPTRTTDHHGPMKPRKMGPGTRKQLVYSYDTPDVTKAPVSQIEATTESQSTREDMAPLVPADRHGSGIARILQFTRQELGKDNLNDKDLSEDDASDSSPEIVTCKQSSGHSPYNSVVSMGGEASTGIGKETPTSSTKSPDHVLEPVPNIPNEPRSSSFGVCIDSEVGKEKNASSGHNIFLEADDVPMNHPVIEGPNYESTISSHHLEGDTTEVLGSTPCRNASTLNEEDDNIEHQGGVGGDRLLQGEPVHPLEILPDAHNQSHIQDGNMEQTVGKMVQRSPNNGNGQKETQRGKRKQELDGSQSLAGFGPCQSGLRRSTRIRSRPLQEWRGERFLYGRIDEKMSTVIGIKSYALDQDGKVALMVKSFVGGKHSKLVAQVAKY